MKRHTIKKFLTLFVAASTLFFSVPVMAEEASTDFISMSPTSQTISLDPGETYSGSFLITNIGENDFSYTLSARPFATSDKDYSPIYDEENVYTELSKWVTFEREMNSAKPNESNREYFTINVPENMQPGGQYIAIAATIVNKSTDGTAIELGRSVASLFYITINGETHHSGEIIENKIPQFFFDPPISVNSLISNSGNVHERAEYIVEVRNFFNNEVVYSNADNPTTHLILPETERYETIPWSASPQLGIFKVKQTINYLGQTSVEEKIVFICPLWLIFLIIFMIFLAFFYIRSKVKDRKKNQEEAEK